MFEEKQPAEIQNELELMLKSFFPDLFVRLILEEKLSNIDSQPYLNITLIINHFPDVKGKKDLKKAFAFIREKVRPIQEKIRDYINEQFPEGIIVMFDLTAQAETKEDKEELKQILR